MADSSPIEDHQAASTVVDGAEKIAAERTANIQWK